MVDSRQRLFALALWGTILAIGWFAYMPALSGTFLLDDMPNLAGLATVNDRTSAVNFVFSGTAGPLGRPLALVTFLPQAAAWSSTAEPFLKVNILIHLGNACVLLWALFLLCKAIRLPERDIIFVSIAASAIWLLMPLLASSSLMIIQRMTTLSAFFVLLGIAVYLWARQAIERSPTRALIGMSVALTIGTGLAAFTKENGVLLPMFVLVMESTLLGRPHNLNESHWRAWKSVFLLLPVCAIIAYLAWRFPYAKEIVLKRDFNGWERLLTESRILWEYLFNAFVPQPGKFGPFHDGHSVSRTIMDPVTFLSFAGWLATLTLAVLWRRRYPLFAFATLWFLGGHLLESTVIPLDLYYEHRNYLPIVGPLIALCVAASRVQLPRKKLVYWGTSAYILVSALVLFSLTSLWGKPSVAFLYWQEKFPDSMYAATAVMGHQQEIGGARPTLKGLRRFVSTRPKAGYLKIHELKLSCLVEPDTDYRSTVSQVEQLLKYVDFSYTALTMLSQLAEQISRSQCNGVDYEAIRRLARALLLNPRYRNDVVFNQLRHQLWALLYQYEGNLEQAIQHLREAIEYKPSTDLNKMMVITFVVNSDFAAAREFIDDARNEAPINPMKRYVWMHKLQGLGRYVDDQESKLATEFDQR